MTDELTLHLGVIDVPYAEAPGPARAARRGRAARYRNVTTGDVAGWLEDRYGVVEAFWEKHGDAAVGELADALEGAIESFAMGAPASLQPFGSGLSKIEDRFKQFLSTKEIESMGIPGVPTQAALRGVSHRFKRAYVRRPARPSFIDTGLYQASFKAWMD